MSCGVNSGGRRNLSGGLLLALAVAGCGRSVVPAPTVPQAPLSTRASTLAYGTYAWNADDTIGRWKAGTLWQLANALHVNRFMLGFTYADIVKYSRPSATAAMNAMIADGKRHGATFEVLLGDPSWIPPSGIPVFESIMKRLRHNHFAGLNLDLEPNEVTNRPKRTIAVDLAASMKRYVASSPWPVTLDVNWIYMNQGTARTGGYCLPCGLAAAKLQRIALMIYISDPKTVAKIAVPQMRRYNMFTYAIAQSVEPPSVLPPTDSYWSDGFAKFYRDMQQLDAAMRSAPNYSGLDIQSLPYLETMPP